MKPEETISTAAYDARKKAVEVAEQMMKGEISFIEGGRILHGLCFDAEMAEFDPDFVPFILINSECDALPLGDVRQYWVREALVRLQPEIERAEKWARETAGSHCQNLIDRFGPSTVRRQIAETARAMLKGDVAFFEGAQRIVFLRKYADLSELDPDLISFAEVASKYDFMPLSDGRENWPREILDQKYPEIRRAEEWARQVATADCQKLIDRFAG